jgi:hypothetical protein
LRVRLQPIAAAVVVFTAGAGCAGRAHASCRSRTSCRPTCSPTRARECVRPSKRSLARKRTAPSTEWRSHVLSRPSVYSAALACSVGAKARSNNAGVLGDGFIMLATCMAGNCHQHPHFELATSAAVLWISLRLMAELQPSSGHCQWLLRSQVEPAARKGGRVPFG